MIEKAGIPSDRQLDLNFERQTARIIVKASRFGDEFKDLNPTLSAVEVYSKLKVPACLPYPKYEQSPSGSSAMFACAERFA